MTSISYMKSLDQGLIEVQKIMKLFNGNRDNEYWSAINVIRVVRGKYPDDASCAATYRMILDYYVHSIDCGKNTW